LDQGHFQPPVDQLNIAPTDPVADRVIALGEIIATVITKNILGLQ
jgi:hypothetical protein